MRIKYQNKIKIILFSGIILAIMAVSYTTFAHYQQTHSILRTEKNQGDDLRPEVKKRIDELSDFRISHIEHTTWGESQQSKTRLPEVPEPFAAGRYKITFQKGNRKKAIICEDERIVGHMTIVVPGVTIVGGSVQLLDNPQDNQGPGPILNDTNELDYFIQAIYKKFAQPINDDEAELLNKTKDCALATMFNGRKGIEEYHLRQIKKLQSK